MQTAELLTEETEIITALQINQTSLSRIWELHISIGNMVFFLLRDTVYRYTIAT